MLDSRHVDDNGLSLLDVRILGDDAQRGVTLALFHMLNMVQRAFLRRRWLVFDIGLATVGQLLW